MPRGHPNADKDILRTSISLNTATERRLVELMLLLRISRSEVIAYLVDREYDRQIQEIGRLRQLRRGKYEGDDS